MKKVELVTLNVPCNACLIITNLIKEMFCKLDKKNLDAEFRLVELTDIKDLCKVDGLEVEKLPAVIIDGEQITAGSLPNERYLISLIKE